MSRTVSTYIILLIINVDCSLFEPSKAVQCNLRSVSLQGLFIGLALFVRSLLEECSFVSLVANSFSDVHFPLNEVNYITRI